MVEEIRPWKRKLEMIGANTETKTLFWSGFLVKLAINDTSASLRLRRWSKLKWTVLKQLGCFEVIQEQTQLVFLATFERFMVEGR